VEGEVLILDGDIELLLGEDFLKKLGTRMKIGALPEIVIGEMPIGAVRNEEMKSRKRVVLREAVWVPGRTMKVVPTEPLDLEGSGNSAMIEPSETLMKTKRVSVGRAVVDGKKTLDQIVITNLSDRKQWLGAGTVLGEIEEIEEKKSRKKTRGTRFLQQCRREKKKRNRRRISTAGYSADCPRVSGRKFSKCY